MTRRSDAIALALSGTMHGAALWAVLAMVAHDRLPALPFVFDLRDMVSEAPPVAPAPPALAPAAPPRPAIRAAAPARRIAPPHRVEPVVTTPPAPVAVAPAPPGPPPAVPAETTLVAAEPVASPTVSAPPVAAAPREGPARIEAESPGPITAGAPTAPPSDVAALPPAPAALPVTRPARPRGGYQVQPAYPVEARRASAEGTTLLRVHVGTNGIIDEVMVERSAGHDALDRAAAEAIRKWRFDPARTSAGAVAVWVVVPVNFQLRPE